VYKLRPNAIRDLRPRLYKIRRLEKIRPQVIQFVRINRRVRGSRIEGRSINQTEPDFHSGILFGVTLAQILPAVARDLNQASSVPAHSKSLCTGDSATVNTVS